jgi:hypothetical protein
MSDGNVCSIQVNITSSTIGINASQAFFGVLFLMNILNINPLPQLAIN